MSERGGVGLGQAFHDGRTILVRQQLGSRPQPPGGRAVPQAPLAELGDDRHQLDRCLGQAVGGSAVAFSGPPRTPGATTYGSAAAAT